MILLLNRRGKRCRVSFTTNETDDIRDKFHIGKNQQWAIDFIRAEP
jgi:hypothetical protein